jgi:DNA replication and repair protein RecF
MRVATLRIEAFRNLGSVCIDADQRTNWLYGSNGAGKTSVLEALHVLGRGRSFRTTRMSVLAQDGEHRFRIFAETMEPQHRLGLERAGSEWTGRIDRQPCRRMSEFAQALPLVLVDPENHLLVEGSPALRRSYLDWGLFHVEPSYLSEWQRYRRLLRQRNAALRDRSDSAVMSAIEVPMASAAACVEARRACYVARLQAQLAELESQLQFELATLDLGYQPSAEAVEEYVRLWSEHRTRDREQGFTREGPHRGELAIRVSGRRAALRFSRGQMKLAGLLMKLAQMRLASEVDRQPILLLDDPVSELDADHLDRLMSWIATRTQQTWITAVEPPKSLPARRFHVEQGKIRAVV